MWAASATSLFPATSVIRFSPEQVLIEIFHEEHFAFLSVIF
jgi:hypothetical protein